MGRSRSSVALSFKRASAKSLRQAGAVAGGRSGALFVLFSCVTLAAGGAEIAAGEVIFSKWGDLFFKEKGALVILFCIFVITSVLAGILASWISRWALIALPRAGVIMVSKGDRLAEEASAQEEAWTLDQALPKAHNSKKSVSKRL